MKRLFIFLILAVTALTAWGQTVDEFKKMAKAGDIEALYMLGVSYSSGFNGCKQDYKEAFKWYSKAAKKGHAGAQCSLGYAYLLGQGTKKDIDKAIDWFKKAAKQGYDMAQYELGNIYYDGFLVPKDRTEAEQWYLKAAASGNNMACFTLGVIYEKTDKEKAIYYFKKAIDQNYAQYGTTDESAEKHLRELGVEYRPVQPTADKGDNSGKDKKTDGQKESTDSDDPFTEFFNLFFWGGEKTTISDIKKNAENGDMKAQYSLGLRYARGQEVDKDYKKAAYWFEKAAQQGHSDAQKLIGACYYNGEGVKKDLAKAVYWFKKAAEQGQAEAQCLIGTCYYNGEGVKKDLAQAVYWYEKAAQQGQAEAQYNLGVYYYNGQGVDKNITKATYWFEKAAEQGLAQAQYFIGLCYHNGYGVNKDDTKAIYWLEKAEKQGYKDASDALKQIKTSAP